MEGTQRHVKFFGQQFSFMIAGHQSDGINIGGAQRFTIVLHITAHDAAPYAGTAQRAFHIVSVCNAF